MKNILVCGDAIMDKYIIGSIERNSPEDPNVPVLDVSKVDIRLGGCLNTASNIRSLSLPEEIINVSTIMSEYTRQLIVSKKIGIAYCRILPNKDQMSYDEIIKERIVGEKQVNKSIGQIVRIDNRKKYRILDIHPYEQNFGLDFNFYDIIVVSDYCKGTINPNTLYKLNQIKNKTIFIDTKQNDLTFFPKDAIFKVNSNEFSKLKNWKDVSVLIVTKGEEGCDLYRFGQYVKSFTAPIVNAIDVTGAGDVHLAGLVAKYAETEDLDTSIHFANLAASISVSFFGTSTITREMVDVFKQIKS